MDTARPLLPMAQPEGEESRVHHSSQVGSRGDITWRSAAMRVFAVARQPSEHGLRRRKGRCEVSCEAGSVNNSANATTQPSSAPEGVTRQQASLNQQLVFPAGFQVCANAVKGADLQTCICRKAAAEKPTAFIALIFTFMEVNIYGDS